MTFKLVIAAGLVFAAASSPVLADDWVPARGESCFRICSEIGSAPVRSGRYQNGNAFTVCRANIHGEGLRPGYNLQPEWSHACYVPYGGKELAAPRYDCLCGR